jgi:hypothetical protein
LEGIEIGVLPTKRIYFEFDTLNLSGISILAKYSDGSSAVVTDSINTNPDYGTVLVGAGTRIISIRYTENNITKSSVFTIVIDPKLMNITTSIRDFINIIETSKNSRVWTLSFWANETYSNGKNERVRYEIELHGNNANQDGRYDLGNGFVLIYDIKGNGSNIKNFRIIEK